MKIFLAIIHLVICVALMGVIMIQHRKSGGFTGSFGGGGTQADTSGGSWQRMNSLTKTTVLLTGGFFLLSLLQLLV
ncbi:MAG: preprotein translocase subunit SecG [Synergistaceae bacterium]|nr:preprotein translocase subunit SecG [Synergistaceae bacterium]MBP9626047.1 preprotein translocase subunit SecG [Synergistaceae bacterium]MBP9956825.1 preprotein translocase subunit SecG [Synergistaceae bacterium]